MAGKKGKKRGGRVGRKAAITNKLIDSAINPQIRALNSQRGAVARDARVATQAAGVHYSRAKQDIDHIYGESADYLNNLKAQQDASASEGRNRSDVAAQALRERLGGTYSGAANDAMSELARLGISGGGNMSGMIQDAAFANSMADQASANARSTFDQSSANAGMFLQGLQGMNTGSKGAAFGRALNAKNDAIAEAANQKWLQLSKIGDALNETRKGRGDLYNQLFAQLQQSGWKGLLGGKKKK